MCSKVFFVVVVRGVKIFLMSVDRLLLFFYSPFVLAANRSLSQGRRRRKKGRKAKDTEERETTTAISKRTIIIQQRREAGKRKMDVGQGQNLLNYFSKRNGMATRDFFCQQWGFSQGALAALIWSSSRRVKKY